MSHFTVLVIGENVIEQLAPFREREDEDNKNAKWDWFTVGGRWADFFKLKKGGYCNSALKRDINFNFMRKKAEKDAAKRYDEVWKTVGDFNNFVDWNTLTTKMFSDNIAAARNFYHKQKQVVEFNKIADFYEKLDDYNISREEYLQTARDSAITTFAVVMNGHWYERGEMGWRGITKNEMDKNEWNKQFNELLNSIPDDTLLTLVDCHI